MAGYNSLSAADKAAMAAWSGSGGNIATVQNALNTSSYGGVNYSAPSSSPSAPTNTSALQKAASEGLLYKSPNSGLYFPTAAGGGGAATTSSSGGGGGYVAPAPVSPAPAATTSSSYTIKPGDTLSQIAAANNTTVAAIQAANPNITNPNLIYAGSSLNIPGVAGTTTQSPNQQAQLAALQSQLQQQQGILAEAQKLGLAPGAQIPDEILSGMSASDYIRTSDEARMREEYQQKLLEQQKVQEMRDLEYQNYINSLKQLQQAQAPTPFSAADKYTELSTQHSIPQLTQDINDLKTLARETEASIRQGKQKQEGRLAPMGLISQRQQELVTRGNEELDYINRQIQTKVDEYNTKISLIGMTMDFMKYDYETAYKVYQDNWNKAFQTQTALFQAADKERDNMRADASVLLDMISKIGVDKATPEMLGQLSAMEMKLGYPTGILSSYVKATADTGGKVIAHNKVTMANGTEGIGIVTQNPDGSISTQTIGYSGTKAESSGNQSVFTDQTLKTASDILMKSGLSTTQGDLINELGKIGVKITPAEAELLYSSALNNTLKNIVPSLVNQVKVEDKQLNSLRQEIQKIANKTNNRTLKASGETEAAALLRNYNAIPLPDDDQSYKTEAANLIINMLK